MDYFQALQRFLTVCRTDFGEIPTDIIVSEKLFAKICHHSNRIDPNLEATALGYIEWSHGNDVVIIRTDTVASKP